MKKIVLIGLTVIALITDSYSQEVKPEVQKRNNHFYFAPFDLFFNTLQLSYERILKNHNTIALIGGFKLSKRDELVDRIGGTGEIQYRINLMYNKEGLSSIVRRHSTFAYFAPFVQYRYEEATDDQVNELYQVEHKVTFVNSGFAGLGFGFRLSGMENRFSLNLYAGGGLKYSDINGNRKYDDFMEIGYTGIAPKVACQIGIAF